MSEAISEQRTSPADERKLIQDRLEQIMLSNKLEPGQRLSENDIKNLFKGEGWPAPSLNFLREIIQSLISEGLIIQTDNRRRYICEFSPEQKFETVAIRYSLERVAVRALTKRLSLLALEARKEILMPLYDSLDRMERSQPISVAEFLIADSDFHGLIASQAGLPQFAALLRPLHRKIFLGGYSQVTTTDEGQRIFQEHGEILREIERGDETAALVLLGRHIIRGGIRWGMKGDVGTINDLLLTPSLPTSPPVPKTREEAKLMLQQVIQGVEKGLV